MKNLIKKIEGTLNYNPNQTFYYWGRDYTNADIIIIIVIQ